MSRQSLMKNFKDLRSMKRGWLDGEGEIPSRQAITWILRKCSKQRETFLTAIAFLTTLGDIELDWEIGDYRPSLEIDGDKKVGVWACLDLETNEFAYETIDLSSDDVWAWLNDQLESCTQEGTLDNHDETDDIYLLCFSER